ncbi:UbiA family prenyltransferase [Thermoactinospora rubra]|uniref:UbiA family prenyltransferase n=1 Tax=Thermoactinospora rubra TaxID=1088767 RepID=UPI001301E488|nr:UbiA family prenyltransferase [Thermoactinospora rubra]
MPGVLALCLLEARPSVLGVFMLRFGAGAVLAGAGDLGGVLAGGLAWASAVFFAYLFNGVTDVAEDRVNHPSRPIASGRLAPATAARVAFGAAALSVAAGLAAGPAVAAMVVALLLLGYAYSAPPLLLKRRPLTSAATAVTAGLLSYAAGFTAAGGGPAELARSPVVAFALAMSLWMGLVGAPAKDLPDAEGDAAAGRRGMVARYGEAGTRIALIVAACALAVCLDVVSARLLPRLAWSALALSAGAVWVAVLAAASGPGSRRPYRGFMATQYAAHLTLLLPLPDSLGHDV